MVNDGAEVTSHVMGGHGKAERSEGNEVMSTGMDMLRLPAALYSSVSLSRWVCVCLCASKASLR